MLTMAGCLTYAPSNSYTSCDRTAVCGQSSPSPFQSASIHKAHMRLILKMGAATSAVAFSVMAYLVLISYVVVMSQSCGQRHRLSIVRTHARPGARCRTLSWFLPYRRGMATAYECSGVKKPTPWCKTATRQRPDPSISTQQGRSRGTAGFVCGSSLVLCTAVHLRP